MPWFFLRFPMLVDCRRDIPDVLSIVDDTDPGLTLSTVSGIIEKQ
jgi:hypothetical protein